MSIHSGWMWLFRRSSGFLGAEVDDTRVSSWRRHHAGLYMTAKLSHMGVDVGGLACPLHHPTVCGHQTRGQNFLSDVVLCHRAAVGGGAFPGVRDPRAWIFDGVLIVRVSA
jgi:hypothetical protein